MDWLIHIEKLKKGETVQFRPKGNSMEPKISSGNLVTVEPVAAPIEKGDVVFCKVGGKYFVHLVYSVKNSRYQIGNNKNHINGIIGKENIFGKVVKVEI